jgi:hypothetical protein
MVNPDWKLAETAKKRIRIIKVNRRERHLDATDMEASVPICLDAEENVHLERLKQAKIYQATVKTYEAPLTPALERELNEIALGDSHLRHSLRVIKESGSILRKFELSSVK